MPGPGRVSPWVSAGLDASGGGEGSGAQVLGHLPVLQLTYQLIPGVGMVVGQHASGVRREPPKGIVNNYPVHEARSFSRCQPPFYQPAVLSDLRPYCSSDVKPPV